MPSDVAAGKVEISGYPRDVLYDNLGTLEARSTLVLIDACFSGGAAGGTPSFPAKVRSKDDKVEVSLADAAAVTTHHDALLTALQTELELASAAKGNVIGAADEAAATAAADTYITGA